MYYIVGLGNPGEEYTHTRHNTGRLMLEYFREKYDLPEWQYDKKSDSRISKGTAGKNAVTLIEPETYMNKSGSGVSYYVKTQKAAEKLIVVYDDLDLPFGSIKISYNRGSGGHRGLESIITSLKTEAFIRIRVGISPSTSSGKLKKPQGEEAVEKAILGDFKKTEQETLKKLEKKVAEALIFIMEQGKDLAMGQFNQN